MNRIPLSLLFLLLCSSTQLYAQLLKVDLVPTQLCEDSLSSGTVQLDILLSASAFSEQDFTLGSSTLFINFGEGEVHFKSYHPAEFHADSSLQAQLASWSNQKYEFLDEFGIFHLVLHKGEGGSNNYLFQVGATSIKVGTLILDNFSYGNDHLIFLNESYSTFSDGASADGTDLVGVDDYPSVLLNLRVDCAEEPIETGVGACEVATNLALNKEASQSSTKGDGAASFAVDGNLIGNDNWGADADLQHTQDIAESWWMVDLGDVYRLDSVKLFNRSHGASYILNRLEDFHLFISPSLIDGNRSLGDLESDPGIAHIFFSGAAGVRESILLNETEGRYVMIKLSGNGPLHMAEVEVYGCEISPCDVSISNVLISQVDACGMSNGSLSVWATGSNLEYSINGGFSFQSSSDFTGLGIGTYEIVVRNALDPECFQEFPNNPVEIVDPSEQMSFQSVLIEHPSDCGTSDASILISAFGNSLEYSIDGGLNYFTDPTFSNLAEGTYQVYIREETLGNCTLAYEGNPLLISSPTMPLIDTVHTQDISDCGLTDGIISIMAQGIDLEYSIDGGGSFQDESTFPSLPTGDYQVVVREKGTTACESFYTQHPVEISTPETPLITEIAQTAISDCGLTDGSIHIVATGINLEYSIDNGQSYQVNPSFSNLAAGSYEVIVREIGKPGCQEVYGSNPIELVTPAYPLISDVSITDASDCGLSDGVISVSAIGTHLEYSLDNGSTFQSSSVFENLSPQFYNLVVRELGSTGCVSLYGLPIEVSTPFSPSIDTVIRQDISDCGIADGQIEIQAMGSSLEYSHDGGLTYQPGAVFTGLSQGSYEVYVRETSNPNCVYEYPHNPVQILAPSIPTIDQVQGSDMSDCGLADGSISITASGLNLEYSIDGGNTYQLSSNFTDLAAGSYGVFVREQGSSSCLSEYTGNPLVLGTPSFPILSEVSYTDPSDCDLTDGEIRITALGENLEYSLDGSNYQASNVFSNLFEGSYSVYVREQGSASCVVIDNGSLSYPSSCEECLSANLALSGSASQSTTRGDGLASFAIDGNYTGDDNWGPDANLQHTQTQANSWWKVDLGLAAALDSVVIYNRSTSQNWLLGRLNNFYVYVSTEEIDGNRSITALNNDPSLSSFFYEGNAGQVERILLNKVLGRYVLIKLPSSGPLHMAEVEVWGCDGPPPPCDVALQSVSSVDEMDCLASDGSINILATGTNLEYSIDGGSSFQSSPSFTDLAPGSYRVEIRNVTQTNCSEAYAGNPVVISGPEMPSINSIIPTDLSDCESSDGSISIVATGNNLEYGLEGDSYQASNQFTGLAEGSYTVYVREIGSTSCEQRANIVLARPEACEPEECVDILNLALSGTASQSSTHGDGVASHAIDGDLEGDDNWGPDANLQHTKTLANPWWKVDLGQISRLDSLEIVNRTSTSSYLLGRLEAFYILSSPLDFDPGRSVSSLTSDPQIQSIYHLAKAGSRVSQTLNSLEGRYLAIRLTDGGPLHLSEVEVWGCSHSSSGASSRLSSPTTPIEEGAGLQLLTHPNPFSGSMSLEVQGSFEGEAQLKWVNALGQVLGEFSIREGERLTLGSGFAAGIYFVQLRLGGEVYQSMVVKTGN